MGKVVGTLIRESDGADAFAAGGTPNSVVLNTVEVDLGSEPRNSGVFIIPTTGGVVGRPVYVAQAHAPYTGKGTRADEAEMDTVHVAAKVTSATEITCYWKSPYKVAGNFKFDWLAGDDALYLPLAGGTLTGALAGTSASFSALVSANNGLLAGGTTTARFQNGASTSPTGTTGPGLEIFQVSPDVYLSAYNYTTSAYASIFYRGVAHTFQINGATTVAAITSTGLSVTGQITATDARITGTKTLRIEATAAGGVAAGSTGPGVEVFTTGGESFISSYNYTTATREVASLVGSTVRLKPGNTTVAEASSTGLAVTGEITATTRIKTGTSTVAGLPTASSAGAGARSFVTDANSTTFASIVAGGGANGVPVYSDGTNWRIG